MSKPEVIARLLTWAGPRHEPAPWEGVCARTFTEFPIESPFHGRWKEGEALIRLSDHEAVVEHLRATLLLVQSRISTCLNDDAPMGAGSLGRLEQEIDAALSQQGKEGET